MVGYIVGELRDGSLLGVCSECVEIHVVCAFLLYFRWLQHM